MKRRYKSKMASSKRERKKKKRVNWSDHQENNQSSNLVTLYIPTLEVI